GTATGIFSNNAAPFRVDSVDAYTDSPLMFMTTNIIEDPVVPLDQDIPSQPWSGAENRKYFFSPQELYARTNFPPVSQQPFNFPDRLLLAGQTNSSYGRYTYYRLLSQLGTDTGPEEPRLNVNYVNVDARGQIVPLLTTNLFRWTNAMQFFTNAADRLIRH